MSIIYSPKQSSTELQEAIAQFLATKNVRKLLRKDQTEVARRKEEKRQERREAFLAKREREHTKLVDRRG